MHHLREIWLEQGSIDLRLPVLPSEYHIKSSQLNTLLNINALGEINLKGKRALKEVEFSSFFPYRYDRSYCEFRGMEKPSEYVSLIEQMKQDGVLRLMITGTDIDFDVTIESFEWGESDGTGDIEYSLEMKEYRHIYIPASVIVTDQPGAEESEAARGSPEQTKTGTYTVKAGDTLSGIARKVMGKSDWKPLYEQNKGVIGSNPNRIYVGQVLVIPGG